VSTGRVYISRDVVFDETVFPFSKLHPNAGARLRSEIHCLHPTLLNPTHGEEHLVGQFTNHPAEIANDLVAVQQGGNSHLIAGNTSNDGCSPDAGHETDMAGESALGSAADQASGAASGASESIPGESAPATTPLPGGTGTATLPPPASMGGTSGSPSVPTRSDGSAPTGMSSESYAPQRPRTRLQSGIRKDKVYTDGTVRYSLFSSTGEPYTVEKL